MEGWQERALVTERNDGNTGRMTRDEARVVAVASLTIRLAMVKAAARIKNENKVRN